MPATKTSDSDRRALAERLLPPAPEDLREARRLLGLSQRAWAARLGLSKTTVAAWETGKASPQADSLRRIVEMLVSGR